MKLISEEIIVTKNQVLEINDFLLYQTITNDIVSSQYFCTKNPNKTHPHAYQPKNMRFIYYGDNAFDTCLENNLVHDDAWHKFMPVIISDLNNFKSFDHLYCVSNHLDSNFYRITEPSGLPLLRCLDEITSSITNAEYNLELAEAYLKDIPYIKLACIKDIAFYNRERGRTKFLYVEYKLPPELNSKVLELKGSSYEQITFLIKKIWYLKKIARRRKNG